MPRTAKRSAQPVRTIPNAPYGEGVESANAQAQVPLPDYRGSTLSLATAGPPSSPQAGRAVQPEAAPAGPPPGTGGPDLLAQALAMDVPPGGLLAADTTRPAEPVTAGMHGPILAPILTPAQRFAQVMTTRTNDPFYADMVRKLGGGR